MFSSFHLSRPEIEKTVEGETRRNLWPWRSWNEKSTCDGNYLSKPLPMPIPVSIDTDFFLFSVKTELSFKSLIFGFIPFFFLLCRIRVQKRFCPKPAHPPTHPSRVTENGVYVTLAQKELTALGQNWSARWESGWERERESARELESESEIERGRSRECWERESESGRDERWKIPSLCHQVFVFPQKKDKKRQNVISTVEGKKIHVEV